MLTICKVSFLLYSKVPYIGPYVQAPFSDYLETQKLKLHRKQSSPHEMVSLTVYIIASR